MPDLLLAGGRAVLPEGISAADLAVTDGRITAVLRPGTAIEASRIIDATDCFVLPGVIDAHVHFREPGLASKEDWEHASAAAVAGGVTTVFDMPNVVPPTVDAASFEAKVALVAGRSHCNYGFYGALAADNLHQLQALAEAGAIGFKVFLGETTASLPPPDDGLLLRAWRVTAALGLRTMVHAENTFLLRRAAEEEGAAGPPARSVTAHGRMRPAVAEAEAIARACLLAAEAGAPIGIAHTSTAAGAAILRAARATGLDVRVEVCPHHLLLVAGDAEPLGLLGKVNPPLRSAADRDALWAAVADGTVDTIGSDHAPHTPVEKAAPALASVPSGFAGVQNTLPLLWDDPHLPLMRLVELLSAGPARAWGLWPNKGRLAVGADADLVVVRPGPPPTPARQWSLHPDSPLLALCQPRAQVVATVVGGRVAFAGGALAATPAGRWIRP